MFKALITIFLSFCAIGHDLSVNGFGTLSYQQSNTSVETVDGVNNRPNFTNNSFAGISLRKDVDERWDFILQILAEDNDGDMTAKVDLLQATYRPNNEFNIRLGKIRLPIWMISNYYNVGALYPWIKPPQEVYQVQPGINLYGANASYRFISDFFTTDVELYFGGTKFSTEGDIKFSGELSDIIGSNITIKHQQSTLRIAYGTARYSGDTSYILTQATSTQGVSSKTNLSSAFNLGRAQFISLGLKTEIRNFMLWTEYALEKTDSDNLRKLEAYYATIGYYLNNKKYLLHFTHADQMIRQSTSVFFNGKQSANTLGLNYAASPSLIFKSEFSIINPEGNGLFSSEVADDKVNLWGISMSFMF